jgi:ABC-type amino acid transport substrate-binding protein
MVNSKTVMAIGMIISLIVGVAVGLVASPLLMPQATTSADTVWDNIVASGEIKAGTDPTWPPYEELDGTTIVGFEIDLADAIAEKLGLTIKWQSVGFDTVIPSMKAKQLDLGVSGFSVIPEGLDEVTFTMPHSINRGQVIMLQSKRTELGIALVNSLQELKNLAQAD